MLIGLLGWILCHRCWECSLCALFASRVGGCVVLWASREPFCGLLAAEEPLPRISNLFNCLAPVQWCSTVKSQMSSEVWSGWRMETTFCLSQLIKSHIATTSNTYNNHATNIIQKEKKGDPVQERARIIFLASRQKKTENQTSNKKGPQWDSDRREGQSIRASLTPVHKTMDKKMRAYRTRGAATASQE